MVNIPNIVRDRLKAPASAAAHPDANLLAAFAEQSLPAGERIAVLEHLAACGDCREIVSLALPASEATVTAIPHSSSGWFTWPAFRWAFVAAGVVAITSFGVVQYRRSTRPEVAAARSDVSAKIAKNEQPAAPSVALSEPQKKLETERSKSVEPFSSTDKAPESKFVVSDEKHASAQQTSDNGIVSRRSLATPMRSGPRLAFQQQLSGQLQAGGSQGSQSLAEQQQAAPKAQQVPPLSEMVEVTGAAAQIETAETRGNELRDQPSAPPSARHETREERVGKAKPAESAQNSVAATPAPVQMSPGAQLAGARTAPQAQWTISNSGALQRSFDQGKSWQDVNVIAGVGATANFGDFEISSDSARAVEKDSAKKSAKLDALAAASFRAVAANGADVWAGGSHGALYHSADSGNHWTRVVPASGTSRLTGDIISLEFPDPQHGTISTSSGELWTTADAGQSWHK